MLKLQGSGIFEKSLFGGFVYDFKIRFPEVRVPQQDTHSFLIALNPEVIISYELS